MESGKGTSWPVAEVDNQLHIHADEISGLLQMSDEDLNDKSIDPTFDMDTSVRSDK